MGIDRLRVIDTGLDPVTAEREQWDDGNNTLALAPRLAVAYERNTVTNGRWRRPASRSCDRRVRAGQRRGGPRCMSCPIARDPLPDRAFDAESLGMSGGSCTTGRDVRVASAAPGRPQTLASLTELQLRIAAESPVVTGCSPNSMEFGRWPPSTAFSSARRLAWGRARPFCSSRRPVRVRALTVMTSW